MSSSAITTQIAQLKVGNVQNQADSTSIYSNGVWSFKNSTALTSVTITDAGNVGIGTASPTSKLHVNAGGNYGILTMQAVNGSDIAFTSGATTISSIAVDSTAGANPTMIFRNGGTNTERMRIDASGNLLVGTTSSQARAVIWDAGGSNPTVRVFKNAASTLANPCLTLDKYDNNTTTSQVFAQFTVNNQGTASGQINANGANQVAFGSWSDERLKENIADLQPQLKNILALRPVEFDYIESEGGGHQIGFVAQEMQQVYADAIGERADGMLSISGWDKTTARLVKAIQELSAKNEALEARLAALEAK